MKKVTYSRDALKDLRRHSNMADRVFKAISAYAGNPDAHSKNVTVLVNTSAKRMRVGDFRVIFDETDVAIVVTKIGPRGQVYR